MTAKPPPTAADSGRGGGGSVASSGLEEVQERGAREVIKLAQFQKKDCRISKQTPRRVLVLIQGDLRTLNEKDDA